MAESLVTMFPHDRGIKIPAGLFGHLLESTGRCIYDGVWVGEDSPIPNDDGLRLDTIEAYRQLKVPNVRLGGAAGEYYHWREGIGPRSQRRKSRNLLWGGYDSNHFGTDEFLRWCEAIGAEPMLQVNVATGDRREALDWMEYCNASPPSELAAERARNGHPEPYGVKYWQIGNENHLLHTPEEYGREVRRFGTYMRQAELDARLIVRGTWNPASDFNQRLLEYLGDQHYLIDLLSLHCYIDPPPLADAGEFDTYAVVAGVELVEQQVLRAAAAIDLYAGRLKHVSIIVDEYGVFHYETRLGRDQGMFPIRWLPNQKRQPSFLRDAIVAARILHVFMRRADRVTVANLSTSINALHSALETDGPLLIRTPTYHVLDMLKAHMNADAIRVHSDAGVFEFPQDGETKSLPNLDIVASASPDAQRIFVSIVNPRLDRTVEVLLRVQGNVDHRPEGSTAIGLTSADPLDVNDFHQPDRIRPSAVKLEPRPDGWALKCAPFSLTAVTLTSTAIPA